MSMEHAAKSVEGWDLIVLPGGMEGAQELRKSTILMELLRRQSQDRKLFAAIGCSPAIVLASLDGLVPPGATCYPLISLRAKMIEPTDYDIVIQHNLVTSQGSGSALIFALQLGEMLYNRTSADRAARALLVNRDDMTKYTYSMGAAVDKNRGKEPLGSVYEDDNAAKKSEPHTRIRDRMDLWRKQNSRNSDRPVSPQLEESAGCGDDLNIATKKVSLCIGGKSLERKVILAMETESDSDVRRKKQVRKKPGFLEQEQPIVDSESRNSSDKRPASRKRRTPPGPTNEPTKSKVRHLLIESESDDGQSELSDSSDYVDATEIRKQKHSTKTIPCIDCTAKVTSADDQKAISREGITANDALVKLCISAPTTSCSLESYVHRIEQTEIIRIPRTQAPLDEQDILRISPMTERVNEARVPLILNFDAVSEVQNVASQLRMGVNADHHNDSTRSSRALRWQSQERIKVSSFFDGTLLPILLTAGWQVALGNRPSDKYYCPPGIARDTGKCRVDYFDSRSGVIDFLSKNTPWKEMKEISQVIQSFSKQSGSSTNRIEGKDLKPKKRKRPVKDKTDGTCLTRGGEMDTLLNMREDGNRSSLTHIGRGSKVLDVEEVASQARLLECQDN